MSGASWESLRLPVAEPDEIWETYHENSKLTRFRATPGPHEVAERMRQLLPTLSLEPYPAVELPAPRPLSMPLGEAVAARCSGREMESCDVDLASLAALLHSAYGETRGNEDTPYPRPFRTVPSAGALYPLELFVHSSRLVGQPAGLYHFNPTDRHLRRLIDGDLSRQIADGLVQPEIPFSAALIVFLTAVFERSTFKYGDRAYRFVLLEAGHVAQNINLAAVALGWTALDIGGFLDRRIDDLLGLDGITHSTVYMVALGAPAVRDPSA